MRYTTENYLHFSYDLQWSCEIIRINEQGVVTLNLQQIPPAKAHLHVELSDTIYLDSKTWWRGAHLNIAIKEDFVDFLPNLGSYLRNKLGDDYILENYKLFVFVCEEKNNYFVAKDCVISKVLPP